jgi:hypothetical protein
MTLSPQFREGKMPSRAMMNDTQSDGIMLSWGRLLPVIPHAPEANVYSVSVGCPDTGLA